MKCTCGVHGVGRCLVLGLCLHSAMYTDTLTRNDMRNEPSQVLDIAGVDSSYVNHCRGETLANTTCSGMFHVEH